MILLVLEALITLECMQYSERYIGACWNKSNVQWQRSIVVIARAPRRARRLFLHDCTLCDYYLFIIEACMYSTAR